jgi:hypothetical protein
MLWTCHCRAQHSGQLYNTVTATVLLKTRVRIVTCSRPIFTQPVPYNLTSTLVVTAVDHVPQLDQRALAGQLNHMYQLDTSRDNGPWHGECRLRCLLQLHHSRGRSWGSISRCDRPRLYQLVGSLRKFCRGLAPVSGSGTFDDGFGGMTTLPTARSIRGWVGLM